MRSFLIASCIFVIINAAPQGYNYNTPQNIIGSSGSSSHQVVSHYSGGGSGGSGLVGIGGGGIGGGGIGGGGIGGGGIGVSHLGGGSNAGGSFDNSQLGNVQALSSFNPAPALPSASSVAAAHRAAPHQRRVLPATVSKHIYIHSAPDEPEEEVYDDNSSEQQHKHYNVVFIKAPHQSVKSIAAQTAQAVNEEKTAIYVLSKKNDVSEIRQALSDSPHSAKAKPEVFFIKYRTPEEAQHAQQTIQAQYDALGGSTNVSDEGFAPISSVVGALDGGNGGAIGGNGGIISGGGGSIGGNGGAIGGNGGFAGNVRLGGSFSSGHGNIISAGGSDNIISSGSSASGQAAYLPPNRV